MSAQSSQQSDYDDSDSDVASNPKRRNNRGSKRKHWMKEEDNAIFELVREYGTKDWTLISKMVKQKYGINKRSAKQCRERWHNHLDPNIKKDPLCMEEEKRLFELHKIYGNKWAQIANEMEGRTDNTIKNHFYSTLRRQLRKINNLLLSTKFELLYGRKMKEVTLDDLYKFMKDCDGEYDDIKGIYLNAIDSVSKLKIDEFKFDANNLIGKERDTEAIKSRLSRRSTRIKDNGGIKQSQEEEPNQVGFYVLMKILKCFREEHKNELFKFETLEVDQASNSIYKNSCNSNGKSSNNKRVSKENFKVEENQKEKEHKIKNDNNIDNSPSVNQTLVPSNIRSLFTKMKTKELNDSESDDDKDHNKFKFQQSNLNSTNFNNMNTNVCINPVVKESEKNFILDTKSPPLNTMIRTSLFKNESDPRNAPIGSLMKDQGSSFGMSKIHSFGKEDRNISINSNISQNYNFDFGGYPNRGFMDLSKPTEINFENLFAAPNPSNFASNMMSKIKETPRSQPKFQPQQVSLNLKFHSSPMNFRQVLVQKYNINSVNNPININCEKGKKIEIEMIDDSNIEIRTVDKMNYSNVSNIYRNHAFENDMNVSYFGSNPLKLQPSFPILTNNLQPYNFVQKEDLDTKSHSKGNKQFENGEAQSSQRLNFEPDFKLLNNKFMNSLKKDSNENCQKINSSPPFSCMRHTKL